MISNDSRLMHETVVRDIVSIINDAKDYDALEWLKKGQNVGSIAKRANNLVIVFPAIVSSSISIGTAILMTRAIEKKCISLLQILFSSMQLTNIDNMNDYVAQFHKNMSMGNKITLDDFLTDMNSLVAEGAITVDKAKYDMVMEGMKDINHVIDMSFNESSIGDYRIAKDPIGPVTVFKEARDPSDPDEILHQRALELERARRTRVTANTDIKFNSPLGASARDNTEMYAKQILSTADVKKANELTPTNVVVNFINRDDSSVVNVSGVIGVKVKMYPVDSMEIISRLASKAKDTNTLFNLVRATTREISFFKDLAFAIDKAKLDAINISKDSGNLKMFKLLERRAAKNKFYKLIRKNDASPITSLIISKEDCEYLRKYNNFDLEKAYNARTILAAYNLLDLTIVDESLELANFMFDDGDDSFETVPFDGLEKESGDNSYKKVINLMSKVNR